MPISLPIRWSKHRLPPKAARTPEINTIHVISQESVTEDVARQLLALAQTLDNEPGMRKAPPSTVLRLYCVQGLEPRQMTTKLHCSRALVYSRLALLHRKLGRPPSQLRQYSAHFEKIEASLRDTRAERINLSHAIDGDDL